MSIKFLVFFGGGYFGFGGGGSADFIFMGAGIFLTLRSELRVPSIGHSDGQNRQSPIASVQRTRSTLASHSAVPRGTNVKRVNTNRAIRIAAQRAQGL